MNLLSKKIALFFVRKNKISADDIELYTYCFEMALSSIVNFSIIILGAIFTHRYIESLLFSVSFIIIRKLIGGFHANTSFGCMGLLVITFSLFLSMQNCLTATALVYISFVLSVIQFFPIALFAPVVHPDNPVPKDDMKIMRNMAMISASLILIFNVFNLLLYPDFYIGFCITYPTFVATVFMLVGKALYKNQDLVKKS